MKMTKTEVYCREAAKRLKMTVHVPVVLVGGIPLYKVVEQLVEGAVADYVSVCRHLICEPNLVNRWEGVKPLFQANDMIPQRRLRRF